MSTLKKNIPSEFQSGVYDAIEKGSENILIDAVAGSGKSTTIVNSLDLIPADKSVLFLAFNKSIVEELKIKIGIRSNVEIRTLHSLGSKVLMQYFKTEINADKYRAFLNKSMKANLFQYNVDPEDLSEYRKNIMQLIDLIRVNLIKTFSDALNMAHDFGMNLKDNEVKIALSCIKWGFKNTETIDFTDMIYLPVVMNLELIKYDYVFIDECQDLNAAQRNLFLKCLRPGGRFIAVGDPKQAIYGFAGADAESFEILKNLPNTKSLPLSVCYRCDSDIVELASKLVPQITSKPGAEKGIVNFQDSIDNVLEGDMVLCRITAPLAKLCMDYIKDNRKAFIKGKDIGTNLITLVNKGKSSELEDVFYYLDQELNKIIFKIMKRLSCSVNDARENILYINYSDKIDTLQVLSEGLKYSHELTSRINSIFTESDSGICLSTIHKSKGLESNRVFILCPEFLYHPCGMKTEKSAIQEANLVYVAQTRAKHYLGYIIDFEFEN